MTKLIRNLSTGAFCMLSAAFLMAVEPPIVNLSLSETESNAINSSSRIEAAKNEYLSSQNRAKSVRGQLFPKVVLEGNYRYLSIVPEIELPIKGMGAFKLGDNTNYSLGPSLYWTMWDKNSIRDSYNGLNKAAEAKKQELNLIERQVLLASRAAFFQVGLAREQVMMLTDALKLAQSQYEDIRINVRAGTKSRMDELSSHQEVLRRMKQLRSARSEFSNALNNLSAITKQEYGKDLIAPMDISSKDAIPKDITLPTVYIGFESVDLLLTGFDKYRSKKLWENHPNIAIFEELALSAKLLSESASSNLWPKLQVSARTSLDYPNGPKPESINQNSFGASLTWIIFEGGVNSKKAKETEYSGEVNSQKKEQALTDLKNEWQKVNSELANLDEQAQLNDITVKEAGELSGMVYRSYKNGSANYIDVENSNFRLLEAKIQAAQTKFRILVNLATLASLAE